VTSAGYEIDRLLRDLAVSAAGVGVFDWDLATGRLAWDDRLLEIFGYEPETFPGTIEAFNARVHPDDLPHVTRALDEAIATCGEYEAEYRIVLPGGRTRWVAARGRALCEVVAGRLPPDAPRRPTPYAPPGEAPGSALAHSAVRVVGAAYDTTGRREGDARVVEVLEAMPAAFFSLDTDWRFTYANAEAERLLAQPRHTLLGRVLWELFPSALGSAFETNYRYAMRERKPVAFDAYYPEPLDAWYEVRAWPAADGLSVYFLETTARRAAQEQAAQAARRAALLAEVNRQLGETLDAEEAVARFARLIVPSLADWCLLTLVDPRQPGAERRNGLHDAGDWRRGLRDVGWAHVEADGEEMLAQYARTRLPALGDHSPLARARITGRPVVLPTRAAGAFLDALAPGPAREAMEQLAPRSAAVLPVSGRSDTLALMTVATGSDRRPLSDQDLETLVDAAARAGFALDNARLYNEQLALAEQLQRSLLTEPPEPDHVQIVARYEPAAEAAQIGGDWYDAFLQADGATMLVIGDVVGHDYTAAAAMGQLRGLLRGIAVHSGDGPANILRGLDQAMRTLLIETTATAIVARIEQSDDERHRGVTHLRWANAGHPPIMIIDADGSVVALPGVDADVLLGVDPESERREVAITLDRGATILLFTDGLVERRDQDLTSGLDRLQRTLGELAHLPLDEMCDELLARLLPPTREDDVALIAVRLHRQDRLRPPEAGPNVVPDTVPDSPPVDPEAG
jgi:serine phosphatase RsbU (regulator of sigma subunit)/PAS domain-containing protein